MPGLPRAKLLLLNLILANTSNTLHVLLAVRRLCLKLLRSYAFLVTVTAVGILKGFLLECISFLAQYISTLLEHDVCTFLRLIVFVYLCTW